MNKALMKSCAASVNKLWQEMAIDVMEKCWLIGKELAKAKAELKLDEGAAWKDWCEENLQLSYSHVSRFLAIGALPVKPAMPKLLPGKEVKSPSIEELALVAGRVKKGIPQELAFRELFFPPPPARTILASDEEPTVKNTMPSVPEVKTKKQAKEYLTRPLALDIIGIVSDKEEVDIFVNRTTLEVIFEGLEVRWKGDDKKLKALKAAKLVLL